MTRGMLATVLSRMAGVAVDNQADAGFRDVPTGKWYTGAVAWAAQEKIIRGFGDGTFGPTKPVTREQAAAFVYRYVTGYLGKTPVPGASLPVFLDADQVSPYAEEALAWAHAAGLMVGYGDGYMGPEKPVTRVQMAKLLTLLDQKF